MFFLNIDAFEDSQTEFTWWNFIQNHIIDDLDFLTGKLVRGDIKVCWDKPHHKDLVFEPI